ncbi:hypothetical protein SCHPADRAFT_897832 [Schizopora paradoxa]|uniref:Uncharacterized protein n=1 Tax=Schizopora paradoxa TaxID=27342 RepID=A0A0H2S8J3_9AGAM|nr:hypothetical protein SCHPADRAFT_897832 [Schizopora paradoxa]
MESQGRVPEPSSPNPSDSRRTRTRARSEATTTSTSNLSAVMTLPPSSGTTRQPSRSWTDLAFEQISTQTGRLVDLIFPGTSTPDTTREAQQLRPPEEDNVALNGMGPEHSAIVMNPTSAPDTQEAAQEEMSLQSAFQQGIAALIAGVDVTTTTYGPNGRTETTEFVRLGDRINDHSDNPNTTLGRRVLAASAGGQAARSGLSHLDRRIVASLRNTTTRNSEGRPSDPPQAQRPDIIMVDSDSEHESSIPPRRTRRLRTNASTRLLDVNPPTTIPLHSATQVPEPPFMTRPRRAVDEIDSNGTYYTRVVDPQSSSASYNVRRRVNADGDEHVYHIPAEGWMDPEFPHDYDIWRGAVETQRRTTQEGSASLGAPVTQVASANSEANRPSPGTRRRANSSSRLQIINTNARREIPAPLGARPVPPPRQNNLVRWRRDRREGRLNMDGDEISSTPSGQDDEVRRGVEDMDRHFDTLLRNRSRINFARRRATIEALDNARDGPGPSGSDSDFPPALREQLEDDTPYYLCPLPQPLYQRQSAVGGERRIAVPTSMLSEFAAR